MADRVILTLDTLNYALDERSPSYHRVDSLVWDSLQTGEVTTNLCRLSGTGTSGAIVGIVMGGTGTTTKPRSAWLLDTKSLRIRALPTDSLACDLEESTD